MKKIQMKVAEYVTKYNIEHKDTQINRFDVYNMIKQGELKAHKNSKGHWIIEIEVKESKAKEYTIKEFVEIYNEKHKKNPVTVAQVRTLASKGIIKARKEGLRKWIIMQSPNRKIKFD